MSHNGRLRQKNLALLLALLALVGVLFFLTIVKFGHTGQ
jgi:hypothetical protein